MPTSPSFVRSWFNVPASVFLLGEFRLFQSFSLWYRKAMESPLKPTFLFPQDTHWGDAQMWFSPCSHSSQVCYLGLKSSGPPLLCEWVPVACRPLEYDLIRSVRPGPAGAHILEKLLCPFWWASAACLLTLAYLQIILKAKTSVVWHVRCFGINVTLGAG